MASSIALKLLNTIFEKMSGSNTVLIFIILITFFLAYPLLKRIIEINSKDEFDRLFLNKAESKIEKLTETFLGYLYFSFIYYLGSILYIFLVRNIDIVDPAHLIIWAVLVIITIFAVCITIIITTVFIETTIWSLIKNIIIKLLAFFYILKTVTKIKRFFIKHISYILVYTTCITGFILHFIITYKYYQETFGELNDELAFIIIFPPVLLLSGRRFLEIVNDHRPRFSYVMTVLDPALIDKKKLYFQYSLTESLYVLTEHPEIKEDQDRYTYDRSNGKYIKFQRKLITLPKNTQK